MLANPCAAFETVAVLRPVVQLKEKENIAYLALTFQAILDIKLSPLSPTEYQDMGKIMFYNPRIS